MSSDKRTIELERSLSVLADVIEHHGDAYWPLYEMLDEELTRVLKRNRSFARRRRLSKRTDQSSQPS